MVHNGKTVDAPEGEPVAIRRRLRGSSSFGRPTQRVHQSRPDGGAAVEPELVDVKIVERGEAANIPFRQRPGMVFAFADAGYLFEAQFAP